MAVLGLSWEASWSKTTVTKTYRNACFQIFCFRYLSSLGQLPGAILAHFVLFWAQNRGPNLLKICLKSLSIIRSHIGTVLGSFWRAIFESKNRLNKGTKTGTGFGTCSLRFSGVRKTPKRKINERGEKRKAAGQIYICIYIYIFSKRKRWMYSPSHCLRTPPCIRA